MTETIEAACHCGAITITLCHAPEELTDCNCSLCRSYGVVWAYYGAGDVSVRSGTEIDTYAWNGKHVDFHRCRACGCVTHWVPRDTSRDKRGVNANLIPSELLKGARILFQDGASR